MYMITCVCVAHSPSNGPRPCKTRPRTIILIFIITIENNVLLQDVHVVLQVVHVLQGVHVELQDIIHVVK